MAVGGIYLAQYLLQNGIPISIYTLPIFLPLTGQIPAPLGLRFWAEANLPIKAQLLTLIAVALFASVVPVWRGDFRRVYRALPNSSRHSSKDKPSTDPHIATTSIALPARLNPSILWIVSVAAALSALIGVITGADTFAGVALALALSGFLAGTIVEHSRRNPPGYRRDDVLPIFPYRGWPWLLIILFIVGVILIYLNRTLPLLVDPLTLAHAQSIVELQAGTTQATVVERILHWPAAMAAHWTGDVLQAGIWRAQIAALAGVVGIWLVACELFRRTPDPGRYGEIVEDDGTFVAVLGAACYPALLVFAHFARIPLIMEPVSLGLFALWGLLIGARKRNFILVGTSGLLAGLLAGYGTTGLAWMGITLFAWLGILMFHRPWIAGRRAVAKRARSGQPLPTHAKAEGVRRQDSLVQVETGLGKRGMGWWAWGTTLVAGATVLPQWRQHASFASSDSLNPLSAVPEHLSHALPSWPIGLHVLADANTEMGISILNYPAITIGPLLGPLILLAIGILFINLDHLLGWVITACLVCSAAVFFSADMLSVGWQGWYIASLPAQALAIAFTLDRIRSAILHNLGSWMVQATIYACGGALIAALAANTITYIEYAALQRTPETELARLLPALNRSGNWHIATQYPESGRLVSPTAQTLIRFYGAEEPNVLHPANWPQTLPAGDIVLIDAQEARILRELQWDFGIGRLDTARNLRSDPVLFVYHVPE